MKMTTAACVCALLMAAPALHAQTTQAASTTAANPLSPVDRDFVQAASMSSSTEIDAAKLAGKNTENKDVKSYAHEMMRDHMKMTVQLKMAAPHGVEVPKDNSDTAVLDALRPLKGRQFDEAYVQKVGLEGHKQAIAAFEKEISEGQDASLKKAARSALPTIKEHYQKAQQLAQKVGVSAQ